MQLITFHDGVMPQIGALHNVYIVNLSHIAPDMLSFIAQGDTALERAHETLASFDQADLIPFNRMELLAPIPRPAKNIVCLGMNYAEHAYESARVRGLPEVLPEHPVFFTKATTAVLQPEGTIPYNAALSRYVDWEVELAFVIGKRGINIPAADAMSYVFGYTILNDISIRDMQKRHQQFYKAKSLDGTAPLGPWIITADQIADPHNLRLQLRVNGELRQDSNTSDMIFKIPQIIEVLSAGLTLEPGDIIATGTPSGVGMGMQPPQYLVPGDVVEAEIDQIGILRNTVQAVA